MGNCIRKMFNTNMIEIKAINPLNYRTVVGFNFDKVTNQRYWDKRILDFYDKIQTIKIHSSFIGLRVNVNESDEFMIKLNVKKVYIDKIEKFYNDCNEFVNVSSFYYECNDKIHHLNGSEYINILINGVRCPITPNAFVQANHIMGNILYSKVNELVKPNKNLIVYGRNSFHIASQIYKKFDNILCINPCEIAFNIGLKMMTNNNYNWSADKSKESLVHHINGSSDDTTIIMSPGRNGYAYFDQINLEKFSGKQVLYITCNEITLKSDIKDNLIIKKNIMIELFPGTAYNEHIVELEYLEND
jgi:tRNA/tmRNA/rRNA uracil-C5-methylase (TrmA/RlmC/RlmD family)